MNKKGRKHPTQVTGGKAQFILTGLHDHNGDLAFPFGEECAPVHEWLAGFQRFQVSGNYNHAPIIIFFFPG